MKHSINDFVFEIRPGSDHWIIDEVIKENVYLDNFLSIKDKDIVIDVGAYIGAFSVLATSKGANVYSYEPSIDNYTLLLKNIESNNYGHIMKAHRQGVMGKTGKKVLYLSDNFNYGAHNFYTKDREKTEEVECLSLKDVFLQDGLDHCDLLKLDCEGSEVEILENYPLDNIRQIAIEYHGLDRREALLKLLKDFTIKVGVKPMGILLAKKI